jgi:RNA polymerase sigma factor (sigma-70 family)
MPEGVKTQVVQPLPSDDPATKSVTTASFLVILPATMAEASSATSRGAPQAFPHTHWSVVLTAGRADTQRAHAALARLCETYWYPLYAYARRRGNSPEDAQDLTQEFFARLLERNTVAQADPERGRFRSFLLASLKNFLVHEWEKSHAQKRGGQARLISLDLDTAEIRYAQPIAPGDTPDKAFDRQWALALLDVVLGRLRKEYADGGRGSLFFALKETLAGGRLDISHRVLGERLGMSEGAVKVAAHRMRQRYRELLREEITNTVAGPKEAEEELQHLFAALGAY